MEPCQHAGFRHRTFTHMPAVLAISAFFISLQSPEKLILQTSYQCKGAAPTSPWRGNSRWVYCGPATAVDRLIAAVWAAGATDGQRSLTWGHSIVNGGNSWIHFLRLFVTDPQQLAVTLHLDWWKNLGRPFSDAALGSWGPWVVFPWWVKLS